MTQMIPPLPELAVAFKGRLNFCSNFYTCHLIYQGITFPTAEHAFQWAKCKNQEDKDAIIASSNPVDAKKIGRSAQMVENWETERIGIMYEILKAKFSNTYIAKRLLDTGDEELVEVNYWKDYFWGVCDGKGENWLGKLLMKIRDELRNTNV